MRGNILPWKGTVCPSIDSLGGHCALVQNVQGGIPHGGDGGGGGNNLPSYTGLAEARIQSYSRKCKFILTSVEYLGYQIDEGFHPTKEMVGNLQLKL